MKILGFNLIGSISALLFIFHSLRDEVLTGLRFFLGDGGVLPCSEFVPCLSLREVFLDGDPREPLCPSVTESKDVCESELAFLKIFLCKDCSVTVLRMRRTEDIAPGVANQSPIDVVSRGMLEVEPE